MNMLYVRETNRGAFLKGGSLRGFPLRGEMVRKKRYLENVVITTISADKGEWPYDTLDTVLSRECAG